MKKTILACALGPLRLAPLPALAQEVGPGAHRWASCRCTARPSAELVKIGSAQMGKVVKAAGIQPE